MANSLSRSVHGLLVLQNAPFLVTAPLFFCAHMSHSSLMSCGKKALHFKIKLSTSRFLFHRVLSNKTKSRGEERETSAHCADITMCVCVCVQVNMDGIDFGFKNFLPSFVCSFFCLLFHCLKKKEVLISFASSALLFN